MLKGLTSTFKNNCNNVEVVYSEYVVLNGTTIPIKAELKDDSYENGNFIGTFILKQISFETDATYEFRNKEFEYYKEVNGESIKIGTFISTDITINDTTEIVKVVGMDYGLKTQVEYTSSLNYASGNVTLLDVWNECCTLSGLESGITTFTNCNFIVDSDQFTGTGATIRDVFKGIAMSSGSFVKVMNDDKIYLVFNEYTSENKTIEVNGNATINDGLKLDTIELQGDTIQNGTPTPDSPVNVEVVTGRQVVSVNGKNLLDVVDGTYTSNGITAVASNGEITLNGTATANNFIAVGSMFDLPTGTYTLSANNPTYISGNNAIRLEYSGGSVVAGTSCMLSVINNSITFTTTEDISCRLRIRTNADTTYNNFVIKPQLEQGSTASEYEEFKEQNYEINLGKNLVESKYVSTSTSAYSTVLWAECDFEPNTTYTISYNGTPNNKLYTNEDLFNQVNYTNTSGRTFVTVTTKSEISKNTSSQYTSGKGYKILKNWYTGTVGENVFDDLMIEKGSQATPYSAYKTPIELCKIGTYQDKIYKENGTWYLHKEIGKVVLDGSENISLSGNLTSVTRFGLSLRGANQSIPQLSSHFTYSTGYSKDEEHFYTYNNLLYLFINNSIATTVADFKTWLSTHNTIVYYVLATPTTTEITDSELIGQLEYIELLEGINNISVSSGDLSVPLKLSYYNNELDTIEDYVELEDKRDTHPWTCLRLGVSQIDGENIDYIDEDLVEKYGENWLILNDNPFAYNQLKRQELISNIFYQIKEFGYSAFTSKTSFKPYLTSGDIIQFKNRNGNLVKSILLRYTHNAEEIQLESPSETSATVNYVYPLSAVQMVKNTQIEVDKDKQQISSIVENVGLLQTSTSSNADNINSLTSLVNSQGEQIDTLGTRITQNVENITASVSAIQSKINEGVSLVKTTSVTIDDNGLSVSTDTSKISTTMTNDTFKITDSGNTDLAYFGYDENEGISKAEMDNLTVTNYFVAGVHRIETMEIDGEERTGWFYIGG